MPSPRGRGEHRGRDLRGYGKDTGSDDVAADAELHREDGLGKGRIPSSRSPIGAVRPSARNVAAQCGPSFGMVSCRSPRRDGDRRATADPGSGRAARAEPGAIPPRFRVAPLRREGPTRMTGREQGVHRDEAGRPEGPPAHASRLAVRAFSVMKSRRGSTSSPIRRVKISPASSASLTRTCSSERMLGSSVVSHSWPGFISPSPL